MAAPWMPAFAERLELLLERHQQRRRLVGPDDARRVGIEGQDERRAAALGGDAADALDDLGVTAVQAVEVAERQHGLVPARRARIIGKPGDFHWRGSYQCRGARVAGAAVADGSTSDVHVERQAVVGQLDAGGSVALVAACGRSWQMCVKSVAPRLDALDDVERFARR